MMRHALHPGLEIEHAVLRHVLLLSVADWLEDITDFDYAVAAISSHILFRNATQGELLPTEKKGGRLPIVARTGPPRWGFRLIL